VAGVASCARADGLTWRLRLVRSSRTGSQPPDMKGLPRARPRCGVDMIAAAAEGEGDWVRGPQPLGNVLHGRNAPRPERAFCISHIKLFNVSCLFGPCKLPSLRHQFFSNSSPASPLAMIYPYSQFRSLPGCNAETTGTLT
jgi:hypothetical protein